METCRPDEAGAYKYGPRSGGRPTGGGRRLALVSGDVEIGGAGLSSNTLLQVSKKINKEKNQK